MNARIPQAASADIAQTYFSQHTPVQFGQAQVFSDESNTKKLMVCTAVGPSSFTLHITIDEATRLANSILDAVDWCQSTPARKLAREQQEQADQIAGGERPQFSGDRVPAWVAA